MLASASPRVRRLVLGLLAGGLVLFLTVVVPRILAFGRIFGAHAGVAMTQQQVLDAYKAALAEPDARPKPVPRIIHQVFHNWHDPGNETLPSDWEETRQSCILRHPTWEYKVVCRPGRPVAEQPAVLHQPRTFSADGGDLQLWTERASRRFIKKEYPWFLGTYDSFEHPVQRVDTLRYFLIRHFGGVYIDLDNGCQASLEPLLYYPSWITDGGQGALSNNIIGSEPEHPYWILMTDSIVPWAGNFVLPYVTISYATGQWYETKIWEQYHASKPRDAPALLRVMMDSRPTGAKWVFFTAGRGGTWDNWDNRLFGWVGAHLFQATLCGLAALAAVVGFGFAVVQTVLWCQKMRQGYRALG
ncbi:Mannosyl phosphorylinositol ceramide synthase SUR1 [Tolypocladium ophioglossoides CBS 100239]|uniref:Mannosyl phosphorylinositol ceramide synthase SUR1 n=1 Tax=Tolypocladium ophioglossoides (strain CBS 100239) TaxID=1163406 RepID=A0A0L0N3L4_TOLOC|nr:Mannosyl phosphorylinositol ceramide synthase SUR1 [Tolypocladium ophioglossoides CBS 100239]